MSDNIQQLCDRLRAMYVPPSLQIELQPRLTREDAEAIIGHITQLERELAEARATIARCHELADESLMWADGAWDADEKYGRLVSGLNQIAKETKPQGAKK